MKSSDFTGFPSWSSTSKDGILSPIFNMVLSFSIQFAKLAFLSLAGSEQTDGIVVINLLKDRIR